MAERNSNQEIDPNAAHAFEALTNRSADRFGSLREIGGVDETAQVQEVSLTTKKNKAKILYLSELLIGNRASDVDFFMEAVDYNAALPEEEKPDAIVLSGLLQGDYKYKQKPLRSTLRPGLQDMEQQFKFASEALKYAGRVGVPVVYTLSSEDRAVAEAYTDVVFRKMQKQAKDSDEGPSPHTDKLRQHPEWISHYRFQTDVVLPYCLRAGRRLRTGEELAEINDGEVNVDEYLLLWQTHQRAAQGKRPKKSARQAIDFEHLRNTPELSIVDDFNHEIRTKKKRYKDRVRHHIGLTAVAKRNNHLASALAWRGQDAAAGKDDTDNLIVMHEQEAVGVLMPEGTGIHSIGGMLNPDSYKDEKGSIATAYGNSIHRQRTTRRRAHSPSGTSIERHDDGRQRITIHNKKLRELSESIPERTAVAKFCDWQTGSITARPDYQAKFVDIVLHKITEDHDVVIVGGDDFVHGRNYPDFPNESQSTGLMSMDSQIAFVRGLLDQSLREMTPEKMERLKGVHNIIGNHEWNSGTRKWHGYSFNDYFIDAFREAFIANGYSYEEARRRVTTTDTLVTPTGEPLKTQSAVVYLGDMGIESRHFSMERGGKGSGGNIPVYQSHEQTTGVGAVKKSVDVMINGHWHHPQYAVFGDKLVVVNGSLAGISGYEYERGYRPVISGLVLYVGGGKDPEIEFILEDALINHKIESGPYSDKEIRANEGYRDDRDFDPKRDGILLPESFAKSALQKKIRRDMRAASESSDRLAELRG